MNHSHIALKLFAALTAISTLFIAATSPAQAALIGAGSYHSLWLKDDATLWSWGDNFYGQLGDGTKVDRSAPVKVAVTGQISSVAGGDQHTVAVRRDGSVLAWGNNDRGQIGDGTDKTRSLPVVVTGVSPAGKAAAAGLNHSLVVKVDGTVASWGANESGQLGSGDTTSLSRPTNVIGMTTATAVAAGHHHSLAVRTDGTLWAWGGNTFGQLGDGTTTNRPIAIQVNGLTTVVGVAAGRAHSIALLSNGTVWTWGSNLNGQLGSTAGTTGNSLVRSTPVQVPNLSGIVAIAAGSVFSVALRSDGTVFVWGYNGFGELGLGTTSNVSAPTRVTSITGVLGIAAGYDHMLLLRNDGTIWAAGHNLTGQLGDGSAIARSAPTQFTGLTNVASVHAAGTHTMAVRTDGTAFGWGYNASGQLGDGTDINRATPTRMGTMTGVKSLAGGSLHSMALKTDGTMFSWGDNSFGTLGNGNTRSMDTPSQIPGVGGMQMVVAGLFHTVCLNANGTVWTWGRNNHGQLGDGTTTDRSTPVRVGNLTGVIAIAAGAHHTMALMSDGTVRAWGFNLHGQVGDGSTTNRLSPVTVSGLNGVTAIAAGGLHSLALRSDKTVRAWGNNLTGQLGDGTTVSRSTPVTSFGASNINSIGAGGYTSFALRGDGSLLSWGRAGMTGSAAKSDTTTPTALQYLRNVSKLSSNLDHTVALTTDGRIFGWGSNLAQQLGVAYPQQSAVLVKVKDTQATRTSLVASFQASPELKAANVAAPGTFESGDLVVEFFNPTIKNGAGNPGIGHYFLTAEPPEMTSIDSGGSGPGWQRTGRTFRAWNVQANAPAGAVGVCRFYAAGPNSHFYTAGAAECQGLKDLNPTNNPALGWSYEGIAFYTVLPTPGGCPAGNYPIYRSYNNRFSPNPALNDGNHRITPSYNDYLRSIRFFGFADEGIAFCAPATTEGGADLQSTYIYPGAEVAAGATMQADFLYSNNGPGNGNGGVINAALPTAVTWTVTCAARNGATCPASLDPNRLREGQTIATWPAGGGLTITARGTAPANPDATSTALEFGSTALPANSSPDPTPDNDSPPPAQTTVRGGTAACSYALSPAKLSFGPTAQASPVSLVARANCNFTVQSDSPWLTAGTAGGAGNATLTISVAANGGAQPRTGTINVSGTMMLVVQSGTVAPNPVACVNLKLQREGDQTPATGSTGATSVAVLADGQCSWSARSEVPWVSLTAGGGGNGNGTVSYVVQQNTGAQPRSAIIVVADKLFVVNQLQDSSAGGGGSDGGGDSGGASGGDSGGSSGGDSG